MRYKILGKSGLRVAELCLGTMTFGEEWGWGASKEESKKIFDAYAKAGGNFIDTANRYTEGTSERFLGEFLPSDRSYFVLATKYSIMMRRGDPNASGNQRKNLVQALDASLKRLKTEYVDLYWVHAWDFLTPVEEVMRALDDVVRQGKVLHVGVSNAPAWIVSQANTIAELRAWSPFVGLQIEYSLIERTPERDLLPMARAFGIAVTPWAVLASGLLTGKYTGPGKTSEPKRLKEDSRRFNERNIAIAAEVWQIAVETGRTPSQVAINWVRQQPGVIIPILGARTVGQMKDNLGALDFQLTAEQLGKLDEVSTIELGFPHDFLKTGLQRENLYSGLYDSIDSPRKRD